MLVRIRVFAVLRERVGGPSLDVELPDGARVSDALVAVADVTDGVPVVLAVNREYAPLDTVLRAGDEIALIPPVSGGAALHARVTDAPLSLDAVAALVRDPRAGAVVTFSGATRDVPFLDYEAYAEMALAELERIVAAVAAEHGLCAAAAEHRVGRVGLGEASVVVAASAPHRPEAFAGARALIDRIKATVPIWKQEEGAWVAGTVPAVAAPPSTSIVDVALGDARLANGSTVGVAFGDVNVAARVTWLGGRYHQLRLAAGLSLAVGDHITVTGPDGPADGVVLDPAAGRHGPSRALTDRLAGVLRGL